MVLVRSALTLIVAACLFMAVPSAEPAGADPAEDIAADLHRQLEAASRGYLDAEATLAGSRQRQADLAGKLGDAEAKVAAAQPQANEILAATYRTGGSASTASMLLALRNKHNAALYEEAKFGLKWLDKAWDEKTGVLYAQVGIGTGSEEFGFVGDHDVWRLPEASFSVRWKSER